MPLIHNWYGARNIYPSRFLFNDPDDCLRLLTHLEKEDRRELAQQNRKYICDRYNLAEKQALVSQLLNRLVRSDTAASPVPGDS